MNFGEHDTTAKPQLARLQAASTKWICHQEKSTLKTAREGHSDCGFALGSASSHLVLGNPFFVTVTSRDQRLASTSLSGRLS
jgi:hypothetical protein